MENYKPHPYGVLPRGNMALVQNSAGQLAGSESRLSPIFYEHMVSIFNDENATIEMLCELLGFCDAKDLAQLAAVNSAWFVFANHHEIWKRSYHTHAENAGPSCTLQYRFNWKTTVIRQFYLGGGAAAEAFVHEPMKLPGRAVYNDVMFQGWMCTTMAPARFLREVRCPPPANQSAGEGPASKSESAAVASNATMLMSKFRQVQQITNLSQAEFREKFEEPNLPVVLKGAAKEWPIYKILDGNFANLSERAAEIFPNNRSADGTDTSPFRCESVTMSAKQYVQYALQQSDERPTYLFDANFGSSMDTASMYTVPPHFAVDDLFRALGNDRPNFRWLIAGPTRGGSSFHVDPNFTSAWNACLTGRKRWLLFPPKHVPPGVFPSEDMRHVTTPVSLTEWLMNYYKETETTLSRVGYEVICEPGDIMFVPCGWWHYVINLEDSVALTQNYVSTCNLGKVLRFLKHMPRSVSGIGEDDAADEAAMERKKAAFYGVFVERLRESGIVDVEVLEDIIEGIDSEGAEKKRKRLEERPESISFDNGNGEAGFTFSF